LARIASLYSGVADKVAAGTAEDEVLPRDLGTIATGQVKRAKGLRNKENYISQRRKSLQSCGSSGSEVRLGLVASEDDWLEVANFKAELESLRVRMIDACLSGHACVAEPARALVDRTSYGTTQERTDRGSLIRSVQDEVATAVRLLASPENRGRR
jgi:hypothetical protein